MEIKFDWIRDPNKRFKSSYHQAQMWLDNEVLKDSDKYVPMKTGMLVRSGIRATELGSGNIVYDTPYARRMYYGVDFEFNKARHPLAQAFWFEAAKAVNNDKWIRGAKKIAGGE
jgi:hypothetical protein